MRVRFAVVLLLLLTAFVHGDQHAAIKSAGMVKLSIYQFTCIPYLYMRISQLIIEAKVQGDHSGRLQPPVDLVPTVLAAIGPPLQLPTAQAG